MSLQLNINSQPNQNKYDNKSRKQVSFNGPLDGFVTSTLRTIDTNQMINSTLVDVVSMVAPRTYIDTKERNKYAGFETFFREITGTVIMCLSSGVVAMGISSVYNKLKDKDTPISHNIWATNDTFDVLKHSWNKSEKNVAQYVNHVLSGISGLNGQTIETFKGIEWDKVQWYDNPAWNKIQWKDSKWKNVANETKTDKQIIKALSDIISDAKADKKDVKKVIGILEHRIANALKVSSTVDVSIDDKKLTAKLSNLIRDTYDLGKHVFNNSKIDIVKAEAKLKSGNKAKTLGSIALVAGLGLGDQYLNRYITKRRTGKDDFVGYDDFGNSSQRADKKQTKDPAKKYRLLAFKALASAGIAVLSLGVMKIKKPSEFIKRLEFTGPITSGNAIKTLYTATLIGRFLASRDENELRETCVRDYLGFLNWLVLGGFVSKGVAQLTFDRGQKNLFNVSENGAKGIKRWLNNVSLKSHDEIASMGSDFAKKNIWKLNVAHTAGLLYSSLALGCALPLLNIVMTKKQGSNKNNKASQPLFSNTYANVEMLRKNYLQSHTAHKVV